MDAKVEYNYEAQQPDELTLRRGDIINDIKVMPGGWWEGTLKDKRGMFPDNFVKKIEVCSGNSSTSTTLKNELDEKINLKKDGSPIKNETSIQKWCKVLHRYEPVNEDELQLVPNDLVEFLGEVEDGWWKGQIHDNIGVFPSNFVSPPVVKEIEQEQKDCNVTGEYCRVLFPYKAAQVDELTLVKGEIVAIISREIADKGWWQGKLNGKVGVFPDNFVEIIDEKTLVEHNEKVWQSKNQTAPRMNAATSSSSSSSSSQYTGKKEEKAHTRKNIESNAVIIPINSKRTNDKDEIKIVEDAETLVTVDEEFNGIERGENAPLLHLTASRAKAPRRRLPSSHHVRNQTGGVITCREKSPCPLLEESTPNGAVDTVGQSHDEENEYLVCKMRRNVPWIEELKLNQLEKKKIQSIDKDHKFEMLKKDQNYGKSHTSPGGGGDSSSSSDFDMDFCQELSFKDKEKDIDIHPRTNLPQLSMVASNNTPTYVPYHLYYQLYERLSQLEEKHMELQQFVTQLYEQLSPSTINASVVSDKL